MKTACTIAALGVCAAASANVIVPNVNAALEADGTFTLSTTAAAGRTFQMTVASGQLSSVVNEFIVGMRFRLNGAATAPWPNANVTYSAWDVYLGPGVAPGSMSNTFASNFSGAPVQVRSGGLAYAAGSFTSGSSPNAFGPTIGFTSGYLYTGGNLTIEMRFSGHTGGTTNPVFDAVLASGGPANGWGVNYAARWTGSMTGTSGTNGNFLVTELVTQPIPEPASLAALGLGALALVRRRRRAA